MLDIYRQTETLVVRPAVIYLTTRKSASYMQLLIPEETFPDRKIIVGIDT